MNDVITATDAVGTFAVPTILLEDDEARRLFLGLAEARAGTVMQIAPAVGVAPDRAVEVFRFLEGQRLAHVDATGTMGPYAGVYSLTEPGVRVARELSQRRPK